MCETIVLLALLIGIGLFGASIFGLPLVYCFSYLTICRLIIPSAARVGPTSLNTVLLAGMLVVCIINLIIKKQSIIGYKKYLFPITLFLIPLMILGLASPEVPYSYQIKCYAQLFITEILPFALGFLILRKRKDLDLFVKSIQYTYIPAGLFGIITFIWASNPWYDMFQIEYEIGLDLTNYITEERGIFKSMTGGTLGYPLVWGQISLLIMSMSMFLSSSKGKLKYAVIILTIINCILTTKRSAIIPMFLLVAIYAYFEIKAIRKNIVMIIMLMLPTIPTLMLLDKSGKIEGTIVSTIMFWDEDLAKKNDLGGSSTSMRMEQTDHLISMISDCPLQGLGYDFQVYDPENGWKHQEMLGYECIIFQNVASSGVIGLIIWLLLFYKGYKKTRQMFPNKWEHKAVHICYYASLLMTGIQSSLFMYMLMILLFMKQKDIKRKEIINNSSNTNSDQNSEETRIDQLSYSY